MTRPFILVTQSRDGWRLIGDQEIRTCAQDVAPENLAATVAELATHLRHQSPTCVLSPASTSCFFVKLKREAGTDLRDRDALAFELEDHLPMDAESFVADFVPMDSGVVSALAIGHATWKPIADAIEAAGVTVRSIVPSAVLATRGFAPDRRSIADGRLLWFNGEDVDAIGLAEAKISDWKHFQADAVSLIRDRQFRDDDGRVYVGGEVPSASMADAIGPHELVEGSMRDFEIAGAAAYVDDRGGPWFDLRRDVLAASDRFRAVQKNLRAFAAAAVVCFVTLAAAGYYRSLRIENRIAELRDQQASLFEEAFPDTKVPGAILKRIRSEHARLVGARGGQSSVDAPVNAPEILRVMLNAIPSDVRFRIESLSITNGAIEMNVQVRSPVDAGAIAAAISAAGFTTDPPVTLQKDAKTFTSTIRAVWMGSTKEAT